jgi:peptidoglycan/xylan/chitin deacetylase (PgdA/CDA1 family)
MIYPTGAAYLDTPLRRQAQMEHDFYSWRDTWSTGRLVWPQGARLGIWLQIATEWFPLDISGKPFLPVGAPSRPWPDTQTYTQRDYGLRVGIFRMMDALQARGLRASALMNARVAERYPLLINYILEAGWETVAAGLDAGAIHHEGLSEEEERAMIAEAVALLKAKGITPVAWHSPSCSQSTRTPALLLEAGFQAMVDWGNDEAPYLFKTSQGSIASLPISMETSDREMLAVRKQPLHDVERSFIAAAERLAREATESGQGRLLTLNLSPWIMGQPYRIAAFERMLDRMQAIDGVTWVGVPEILAASQLR